MLTPGGLNSVQHSLSPFGQLFIFRQNSSWSKTKHFSESDTDGDKSDFRILLLGNELLPEAGIWNSKYFFE